MKAGKRIGDGQTFTVKGQTADSSVGLVVSVAAACLLVAMKAAGGNAWTDSCGCVPVKQGRDREQLHLALLLS